MSDAYARIGRRADRPQKTCHFIDNDAICIVYVYAYSLPRAQQSSISKLYWIVIVCIYSLYKPNIGAGIRLCCEFLFSKQLDYMQISTKLTMDFDKGYVYENTITVSIQWSSQMCALFDNSWCARIPKFSCRFGVCIDFIGWYCMTLFCSPSVKHFRKHTPNCIVNCH